MNLLKTTTTIVLLATFVFILSACSSDVNNPVQPNDNTIIDNSESSRSLIGMYTIEFDPDTMTAKVHANRAAAAHYNVTSFIPLSVSGITMDPLTNIWTVDVTLTNTFALDGYDLRLIIYTDNYGIKLQNPDDWTDQWDIPGGMQINPFIAYVKDSDVRKFAGLSQHTEILQIYLPVPVPVNLAVDVSYPGNCEEPYRIVSHVQGVLVDNPNSSVIIDATVYDHQDDVDNVHLYCPAIAGDITLPFDSFGNNWWSINLQNTNDARAGRYSAVIIASSAGSGSLTLYDMIDIDVNHPVDGFQSVRTWGDSSTDYGSRVTTDPEGNIFVGGVFSGRVDFGHGNYETSTGDSDGFVLKINNDGTFGWVKHWASTTILCVMVDDGNIYMSGFFRGTVDFGDGNPVTAAGAYDAFLLKLNPGGEVQWVKTWGSTQPLYPEDAASLSLDSNHDIYVGGRISGTTDFGDGNPVPLHGGLMDSYLCKYQSDGSFLWVITWGGTETCACSSVIVDNDYIYTCGSFYGTVDFGDGNPITAISFDTFLSRFNLDSNFDQVKTWNANASSIAKNSTGDIFVIGDFQNTVDFGDGNPVTSNGDSDIALCKYNSDMIFQWIKTWGAEGRDYANQVTVDSAGQVYACGSFSNIVDFGNGSTAESFGFGDAFIIRLDGSYNTEWVRNWGGIEFDSCGSIAIDFAGNNYSTGSFSETVDFGDGYPISSKGMTDGYLIHWAGL